MFHWLSFDTWLLKEDSKDQLGFKEYNSSVEFEQHFILFCYFDMFSI